MKPKHAQPDPPEHLSPAAARWWSEVVTSFVLESHHVKILTLAAECWDKAATALAAVKNDGMFQADRWEMKHIHPGVKVHQENVALFLRAVRELGLDIEPPEAARPPRITGRGR